MLANASAASTGPDLQTVSGEDDEISLLDLLQVVADNLRLLVLGPLVVGLAALGFSFTIAPTFTATTKFMPPQQQQSGAAAMLAGLGALGGLAGGRCRHQESGRPVCGFSQKQQLARRAGRPSQAARSL